MTDNEIIKALECHSRESNSCGSNCPYLVCEEVMCTKKLSKDALDLINRQKAEIERYEKESKEKFDKWLILDKRTKERYAELYEVAKDVVRNEAIKEFAERFIQEDGYNNHIFDDCASILVPEEYKKGREEKTKEVWELIGKIKKEMVGEG